MNTLITDDRLDSIKELSLQAPKTYGCVAEVGVYKGGSLLHLCKLFPDRDVIGFDTFEGLPEEKWDESEPHKPGDFSDTCLYDVDQFLRDSEVSNFILRPGLFPLTADIVRESKFVFVHIDTDFYQSVKESLLWFWPRMVDGGIMVFDDYKWPNCPGVEKALNEFGQPIKQLANYQAYITKKNTTNESPLLT